jgi:hypothetical protein
MHIVVGEVEMITIFTVVFGVCYRTKDLLY